MAQELTSRGCDEDSWRLAREAVAFVGPILGLYGTTIRSLRKIAAVDVGPSKEELRGVAIRTAEMAVRVSPTLTASFAAAARQWYNFFPDRPADHPVRELLKVFDVQEIPAVISLSYLAKLMQKRCGVGSKEWQWLLPRVLAHVQCARLVGHAVPEVGAGTAMVLAGLRMLSVGAMIRFNEKQFKTIRRICDSKQQMFALDEEEEHFRFYHFQVASLYSAEFGFSLAHRMALGSLAGPPLLDEGGSEFEDVLQAYRFVLDATEYLHRDGKLSVSFVERHGSWLTRESAAALCSLLSPPEGQEGAGWLLQSAQEIEPLVRDWLHLELTPENTVVRRAHAE